MTIIRASHPNEGSGMASTMHDPPVSCALPHWLRSVGIAAAAAVSMTIAAPQASADSGSYQPALDQLLAAMQQAVAYDSGLPFATADSDTMLLTGLQNTNYELLSAGLSRVTELFDGVFFQSPEAVATDAADSRQYFQFFTPDIYYPCDRRLGSGRDVRTHRQPRQRN